MSPSEGHNPLRGSARKFASQRALRGLCRSLFESSAGPPPRSACLCGVSADFPTVVGNAQKAPSKGHPQNLLEFYLNFLNPRILLEFHLNCTRILLEFYWNLNNLFKFNFLAVPFGGCPLGSSKVVTLSFVTLPKEPSRTKNTTDSKVTIRSTFATAIAKHHGGHSENHYFPREIKQQIATESEKLRR